MNESAARAHVRAIGRVQGVNYRRFTQRSAANRIVTGWVRNCPDGSVEAVLEGDKAAVESLIDEMRQGPANAEVQALEVEWLPFSSEFQGFQVRR